MENDGSESPYARRFPNADKFTFEVRQKDDEQQRFSLRKSFQSAPNSPYAKRRTEDVELKNIHTDDHIEIAPETSSDEENVVQMEGESHNLPLELVRKPSMQSLRQRRDPLFQGTRMKRIRRVIYRNGKRNVSFMHIPQRSARFFKDFVTTLIEEQWRYTLALFAFVFFSCWIIFALLWWLIAFAHGDLTRDAATGERLSDGGRPCIEEATCMASFLLFSIETQVGIGFGTRYPTEECPEALFLMVVQLVLSVAIEGAMVGIVYAKMVRPTKSSEGHLKFSRKAVVCCQDGRLCLMFRICDPKENHVIGTTVKAFWMEARKTREGERIRECQHTLTIEDAGHIFLLWPSTVMHVIDDRSPLYDVSARDLLSKNFEIVLTMTGGCRSTGQLTQTRTSYLPRDILWGHKFTNLLTYSTEKQAYVADYEKFDALTQIDTPLCSARRLEEIITECTNMMHHEHDMYDTIRRISEGSWEGSDEAIVFTAAQSHPELKSI